MVPRNTCDCGASRRPLGIQKKRLSQALSKNVVGGVVFYDAGTCCQHTTVLRIDNPIICTRYVWTHSARFHALGFRYPSVVAIAYAVVSLGSVPPTRHYLQHRSGWPEHLLPAFYRHSSMTSYIILSQSTFEAIPYLLIPFSEHGCRRRPSILLAYTEQIGWWSSYNLRHVSDTFWHCPQCSRFYTQINDRIYKRHIGISSPGSLLPFRVQVCVLPYTGVLTQPCIPSCLSSFVCSL